MVIAGDHLRCTFLHPQMGCGVTFVRDANSVQMDTEGTSKDEFHLSSRPGGISCQECLQLRSDI